MEQSLDIPVELINVNLDDREVASINQYAVAPTPDELANEEANKNIL